MSIATGTRIAGEWSGASGLPLSAEPPPLRSQIFFFNQAALEACVLFEVMGVSGLFVSIRLIGNSDWLLCEHESECLSAIGSWLRPSPLTIRLNE